MRYTISITSVTLSLFGSCATAFFIPPVGTTWNYILEQGGVHNPNDSRADVYFIDMRFPESPDLIKTLHGLSPPKKVFCYFNGGAYDNQQDIPNPFSTADVGKKMINYDHEFWLNLRSPAVREVMRQRIVQAKNMGCDGVDPDNVDGYCTDKGKDGCETGDRTGFTQTKSDTVEFMLFLASVAHSSSNGNPIAIGLKNAGEVAANKTLMDAMQWSVNEQCVETQDCDELRTFIDNQRPVFHVEYKDEFESKVPPGSIQMACNGNNTNADSAAATNVTNFSTIYKLFVGSMTENFTTCAGISKRASRARALRPASLVQE
ncbi:hypothetical protein G7Y89_g7983 [Cudoniella acicularis]|uniref:alpha-galactosidase n=1 Tax=Cudoniella acicularis TaxID=354080 RepID=A0A8H4W112_9HELO|nr:hypothetical protein G7Y89_g7983 [Cudoniella acicularis]